MKLPRRKDENTFKRRIKMSAESFRHCYSNLPEATLLLSAEGRIIDANRAAKDLVCFNGNLLGAALRDLVQDPPEKVRRFLELSSRSRDLFPGALIFKNGSGNALPCRVEGAVFDAAPEGKVVLMRVFSKEHATRGFNALNERIAVLNREVLERKRTEAKLFAEQQWLKTTLTSIGDGVIATDSAGRIVFLNSIAQALTGWTPEDAVGKPLEEIFIIHNERTGAPTESPVHKALREERIVALANHTRLTAKDGRQMVIGDSAAPVRDAEGRITGVVMVFNDITERERAQEKLERAIQFDEAVMANMGEGLYTLDHEGLVTFMNPAAEKLLGWTFEELRGRSMHDMTHHHHPDGTPFPREECAGFQVLQHGIALTAHEDCFIRKDGSFFDVVYSSSQLRSGTDVLGLVVVFRDVSEHKRAVDGLRKSTEELRRANDDLNQFAFAASHDLQEPLRMITTYAQLLVKSYKGQLAGEAELCVNFITDGAHRMRELLADLLDYTQVNQRDGGETAPVDLNRVFRTTLENLQTAIEESKAVITAEQLPTVIGYEPHFVQLLQNLVGNAIKYRGQNDPRVHVSAQEVDGLWRLAVSDNGIGIDPEYHQSIFGVFKRLHGKDVSGTGIGLAICQRVVDRYGGRLWVESQLNHGATFYCTLPAAIREQPDGQ
jgi:PAS domain S-box-containing protein